MTTAQGRAPDFVCAVTFYNREQKIISDRARTDLVAGEGVEAGPRHKPQPLDGLERRVCGDTNAKVREYRPIGDS